MTDPGNPESKGYDPQAPKVMRPRRPVLDEPLEDVPAGGQEEADSPGLDVLHDAPEPTLDATQELKPASDPAPQEVWLGVQPPSSAAEKRSPYFPHGIYEDARKVEAYYGRGRPEEVQEEEAPAKAAANGRARGKPAARWLILLFAALMILALLLLALTEGIPLGFF
jgi:hypothetical protein